ncbi:MAG: type II toxin-antitoxin system HicB family antitoxin [Chlamydiae bacterium]|nr:type II toxin-antitoxin system HicB family antitoxin [Chlamydiota bacterium]MBI3278106.1 type II toxin-antitoxin system HicB family antitoxin [Chlamydiota bacterium]
MKLKIILEEGDDGYITARVPSLPGCHSQGRTQKEAMRNIKEAILLYLEPDPKDIRPRASHKVLSLAL